VEILLEDMAPLRGDEILCLECSVESDMAWLRERNRTSAMRCEGVRGGDSLRSLPLRYLAKEMFCVDMASAARCCDVGVWDSLRGETRRRRDTYVGNALRGNDQRLLRMAIIRVENLSYG